MFESSKRIFPSSIVLAVDSAKNDYLFDKAHRFSRSGAMACLSDRCKIHSVLEEDSVDTLILRRTKKCQPESK